MVREKALQGIFQPIAMATTCTTTNQQGDRTSTARTHAVYTRTHVLTRGLSCVYARVSSLAVREKAKFLVALLKDQERLKEERDRAKQARSRLLQGHSGGGVSGDFGRTRK